MLLKGKNNETEGNRACGREEGRTGEHKGRGKRGKTSGVVGRGGGKLSVTDTS